ncbi:hypothetical protein GCM10028791_17320 [Echinicola sediminis]
MLLFRKEEELGRLNLYAVAIILIALIMDSVVLWFVEEKMDMVIKNTVNIVIILTMFTAYFRKLVHFSTLTIISIYTIYLNNAVSLILRGDPSLYHFEVYFLKIELVMVLLMIGIGLLTSPVHMIYSLIVNSGFILMCVFLGPEDFSLIKYLFFFLVITGAGLIGWRLYVYLEKIRRAASEAKDKIMEHNVELIEINKQKDQLFRIIGHDIRTPLSHIELLLNEMDSGMEKEAFDEMKALMLKAAEKGNSLLQDLLVWAKAQASEAKAVMESCSPYQLSLEEMEFVEGLASTKGIKVINNVDPELKIIADENMTSTIIRNLLSNAVKFSFRNSSIKIELLLKADEYWLQVKDEGVGMKMGHVQEILREGKVTSMRGTEKEEGTGFGIMICQKLAEHQGGRIDISSEYGKGSIFSLVLPVR